MTGLEPHITGASLCLQALLSIRDKAWAGGPTGSARDAPGQPRRSGGNAPGKLGSHLLPRPSTTKTEMEELHKDTDDFQNERKEKDTIQ